MNARMASRFRRSSASYVLKSAYSVVSSNMQAGTNGTAKSCPQIASGDTA